MSTHHRRLYTTAVAAACAGALAFAVPGPAQAGGSTPPGGSKPPSSGASLPLGRPGLPETRTTETVQPGVTLTTINRGASDGTEFWTVELVVPAGSTDPDPDAPASALRDEDSATQLAGELIAQGFAARAEQVITPALADYAGGELGWRVRVGQFATQVDADAQRSALSAAGYSGSSLFTGWDGESSTDSGPWVVQVVTIDPKKLRGSLDLTYGPDIEQRETTSALAAAAGATVGLNAGFFVLDPNNGAPGDPAGVGVYDGRLLSETVNGRPALVINDDARHTEVGRFTFSGSVSGSAHSKKGKVTLPLDGINRHPGKIRNCGGLGDQPTDLPLHDYTCTDDSELVVFTPEYGASTPTGDGAEVVLDRSGRVTAVRSTRGGSIPASGRTIQATGTLVADLLAIAKPGRSLTIKTQLRDERGKSVSTSPKESIVNGGPELVRDGKVHVTVSADGFVRESDPSWYYGWAHKRNPRTFAGVDKQGRTLLVTSDGRDTDAFGLSIAETGAVAKSLGMVDALNLDGGGSTTLVVDGQVANDPSDSAGERPVGDALLILPGRSGKH